MKLVYCAYFLTGVFDMAYQFWGTANAQYFEDPNKYFKKFEFDWMNRGAFNISQCLKDLMNCYELVKGDVICQDSNYADTVCVTTRATCHDYHLDYDSYGFRFTMVESVCKYDYDQQWT